MLRGLNIVGLVVVVSLALNVHAKKRRRGKGAISIECSIDGAQVSVNGKLWGNTPLKPRAVRAGTHTVTVRRLGFLEQDREVTVRPGKVRAVRFDLLPFAGVIRVTSNVAKAEVLVDDIPVGSTPLAYEVELGHHEIAVVAPGYAPHRQSIDATLGNTLKINARLNRSGTAATEPSGDLELTPLPVDTTTASTGTSTGAPNDYELNLAPLAPLPTEGAVTAGGANPGSPSDGATLDTTVGPAQPWYLEWWAWTAAAVVVAGVVTTSVLVAKRKDRPEEDWDLRIWAGDRHEVNKLFAW